MLFSLSYVAVVGSFELCMLVSARCRSAFTAGPLKLHTASWLAGLPWHNEETHALHAMLEAACVLDALPCLASIHAYDSHSDPLDSRHNLFCVVFIVRPLMVMAFDRPLASLGTDSVIDLTLDSDVESCATTLLDAASQTENKSKPRITWAQPIVTKVSLVPAMCPDRKKCEPKCIDVETLAYADTLEDLVMERHIAA